MVPPFDWHRLHSSYCPQCIKNACETVPFDVEHIIVKIYSHFYIYAVRTKALKEFCDEADVEYMKLLGYAKTRFLALGPAIKRILKLFDALKLYFVGLQKGEKVLKNFFEAPDSKFWLIFIQEQVNNSKSFRIFGRILLNIFFCFIRLNYSQKQY